MLELVKYCLLLEISSSGSHGFFKHYSFILLGHQFHVGLCFAVVYLWHFSALYLRDGWGDRPETFTYDWKCGHLDFGGVKTVKFKGLPPKNWDGGG